MYLLLPPVDEFLIAIVISKVFLFFLTSVGKYTINFPIIFIPSRFLSSFRE